MDLAPGQTVTQSYQVGVSDGGTTVVNQTVSITVGADTNVNFNARTDTIDLPPPFASIQSQQ